MIDMAVFISGRGSNLHALIEAAQTPDYPARIALVVSNNPDAPGLQYARDAGITTFVASVFPKRADFARIVSCALNGIDLIALAGFMRILDSEFVDRWRGRIVNIHPSLLPDFPGLHPQRQALAAGVKYSGCTVHHVVPQVDSGLIIAQAIVPVERADTEDMLTARILEAEHQLYPIAIDYIARRLG
jgi:phosphoribosylglycinamide formyltransferase-1